MNQYITDIANSGQLLTLSDGSRWAISSFESFHTRMWMRMDQVEVHVGEGKLTNLSRRQTVDVRRA